MITSQPTRILRIDSSARGSLSLSNQISEYLWQQYQHSGAELVAHHDFGKQPLPSISAEDLVAIHDSQPLDRDSLRQHRARSDQFIAEIHQADVLVIGAPLYNFGIPATLKQWVDYIARAGQTFRYTENGPQGLSGIREAFVVVATGGTAVGSDWDHASAYLRTLLAFIGVETVHVIDASGSKQTPEQVLQQARAQVDAILGTSLAA